MTLLRATDSYPDEEESEDGFEPEEHEVIAREAPRHISSSGRKRPQDQTNEEWRADYCSAEQYRAAKSGEPVRSSKTTIVRDTYQPSDAAPQAGQAADNYQPSSSYPLTNASPSKTELCFCYIDHRTTRTGSVVLKFESLDGRIGAVTFFNVSLKSNRDNLYPSGKHGQFIPPKGGNFRKLWMRVVGKVPSRWSRVHKSMRSNFRDIIFTGRLTEEVDSKGLQYFKLRDVEPKK